MVDVPVLGTGVFNVSVRVRPKAIEFCIQFMIIRTPSLSFSFAKKDLIPKILFLKKAPPTFLSLSCIFSALKTKCLSIPGEKIVSYFFKGFWTNIFGGPISCLKNKSGSTLKKNFFKFKVGKQAGKEKELDQL